MPKLHIPSLCILQYTGEHPRKVVEIRINRREKVPVLTKGDCLAVTTAIGMMMIAKHPYFEMVKDDALEEVLRVGASVPASDTAAEKEAAEKEAVFLTKENVMQADIKEIKAACKKHGVTIGKKNKNDLVALLLPYLS